MSTTNYSWVQQTPVWAEEEFGDECFSVLPPGEYHQKEIYSLAGEAWISLDSSNRLCSILTFNKLVLLKKWRVSSRSYQVQGFFSILFTPIFPVSQTVPGNKHLRNK